jgi:hypothetical protein
MERQVVDPRAEIDILRVRFPHNLKAEELFVELA